MKFTEITKIKFMSHVKIKTIFHYPKDEWGSTGVATLFCHHDLSTNITLFYHEDGSPVNMSFQRFDDGKDLWDAVNLLMRPFKNEWGKELKEGVEYTKFPFDDN